MPHLLIAGSTGTGKSVGLNAMLTGILYRATPDDVRMIMVDPKRLELGMYEDIPHLMTPVVVEPKKAANALRWAVREMEERYKTLAAYGVRNIEQFNRNVRAMLEAGETPKEGEPTRPLPFIVVVVDELADLMMVAGNEVEESICRLAQMARAVGIHLDPRDAASVGRRHHRLDQGQPAVAHFVPRVVEDRLAHDSRQQRRRTTARQGRHAVPAAGLVAAHPPARPVHLRAGIGAPGQLPAQAGQAGLRRDDHRGRQEGRAGRASSSRRTSSTTRPRASSSRPARRRSRTCSARCGSDSAAPRGWST